MTLYFGSPAGHFVGRRKSFRPARRWISVKRFTLYGGDVSRGTFGNRKENPIHPANYGTRRDVESAWPPPVWRKSDLPSPRPSHTYRGARRNKHMRGIDLNG